MDNLLCAIICSKLLTVRQPLEFRGAGLNKEDYNEMKLFTLLSFVRPPGELEEPSLRNFHNRI